MTRITPHWVGARAAHSGRSTPIGPIRSWEARSVSKWRWSDRDEDLWVSGQDPGGCLLLGPAAGPGDARRSGHRVPGHAGRFASWDERQARRRAELALVLCRRIFPAASPELGETLRLGALALDVGRSVDYYNRHRHAGWILRNTRTWPA
ncbi:MAG: hypothetical protein IPK72_21550 [Candidatus Eisenbacteria bacterium]|nr:hypothetical protein [Candidatus Eisenbacteria bacterium]